MLGDGRTFIGTRDAARETISVQAAVRGGSLTHMQPITIRVPDSGIASLKPYDGSLGTIGEPNASTPNPQRETDIARQREAAAIQAERRRKEAAERERLRLLAAQREEATRRVASGEAALREAAKREQEILANASRFDEDRRLKLELANALQLQLNEAKDRWNQEVQTLGPRTRRPDGTRGGGPTDATETLVNSLQDQIGAARQAVAAIEQRKAGEAEERQRLIARRPLLDADIEAARTALAGLAEPASAP